MTQTMSTIAEMHAAYCRLTGFRLALDMAREQMWYEWTSRGLGVAEVVALIGHHRRMAAQGKPARSLVFRGLVGRVDYAEEDLAMIRAQGRVPQGDRGREEVLAATGRATGPQERPARAAGEILSPERLAGYVAAMRRAAGSGDFTADGAD